VDWTLAYIFCESIVTDWIEQKSWSFESDRFDKFLEMMKLVLIVFTLATLHLNAQYESINWIVAGNTMLNFTTTPAVVTNTFPLVGGGFGSSVSDAAGNLKVVTSTGFIYNAQGQLVAPQNPTVPAAHGEQSGLAIPMPGNPGLYYIFFTDGVSTVGGLSYSIFDPSLAGGAGSLTVMNNTVNAYNTNNGLCAIRHCNGKDVWVVCGQDTSVILSSYKIYSYLLSAAGINTVPVISSVSNISNPLPHGISYLLSSPDGKRLAIGSRKFYYPSTYSVAISDFDRATGAVSNAYLARVFPDAQAGANYFEFSPDGSKLYTVERPKNIVQLNLCAGSPSAVVASANTVVSLPAASTYSFYRGIQRAINGYIYLTQWSSQGWTDTLAAIQKPNNAGSACAFSLGVQSVGTGTYSAYLPHYAHFQMNPLITINQPYQSCSKVAFSAPLAVCAGSLSTFYWDFGEPASQTNTTSLYSPTHNYDGPGNYNIKLVMKDGVCAADTIYKTITVLPNTTLNVVASPLSQTICPGQTTTLTASGALSYTWVPGNLSGSQVSVSPASNTSYKIMGADSIGCTNSSSVSVSVYPVSTLTVTTNPQTVCAGKTVTLTVSGASSYTWNTGPQSPTISVTPANTTIYTIAAVGAYSCWVGSIYTLNVKNCTGLKELNENKNLFAVYPNPATEAVNVELQMENAGITSIEIYNSLEQIVYTWQNLSSSKESPYSYRIDIRGHAKGIYYLKVSTSDQCAVRKLLLE
jgi:hypothetical protein